MNTSQALFLFAFVATSGFFLAVFRGTPRGAAIGVFCFGIIMAGTVAINAMLSEVLIDVLLLREQSDAVLICYFGMSIGVVFAAIIRLVVSWFANSKFR